MSPAAHSNQLSWFLPWQNDPCAARKSRQSPARTRRGRESDYPARRRLPPCRAANAHPCRVKPDSPDTLGSGKSVRRLGPMPASETHVRSTGRTGRPAPRVYSAVRCPRNRPRRAGRCRRRQGWKPNAAQTQKTRSINKIGRIPAQIN